MASDPVFVEASLFFVEMSRLATDPENVKTRARIVYGEARLQSGSLRRSMRTENADGVRILRITEDRAVFEAMLTAAERDHQGCRFSFGLRPRPPILGLMPGSTQAASFDSRFTPSVVAGAAVMQFVQLDKSELATSLVEACTEERVERALDRISALTSHDLRTPACVAMFGDVYLVDDRAVRRQVVSWEPIFDGERHCLGVRIVVDEEHALADGLDINARVYGADDAPLIDRLLRWKPGSAPTIEVSCNQPVGGAWVKVWSNGDIIAELAFPLVRSILNLMSIQSGSIWLDDKLTSKTAKAVQGGQSDQSIVERVATVAHHSPLEFKIGSTADAPWAQARMDAAADLFGVVRPSHEADSYFPKGAEGRVLAVDYLRKIIATSAETLIVDPYFDEEAARALLPRIEHQEAKLAILTWLEKDDAVDRLMTALRELDHRGLLPTNLVVRRLPGAKQSFHDRNIVFLEPGSRRPTLLSMTNSLSGWAKDFSLSIHRPTPYAAASRLNEIRNHWSMAEAHVMWPERNRATSPPRLDFFPRWQDFLEWFVPKAERCERGWLRAAAADGWLMVHADESIQWRLHQLGPEQQALVQEKLRSHFSSTVDLDDQMVSLLVWREANSRALPVTASQIASLVRAQGGSMQAAFVGRLTSDLRRTFVADIGRASMAVRSEFAAESSAALAHDAFIACNGRFAPLRGWQGDRGREFAYAVLAALDPDLGVGLMFELNDPTMFVLLTSSIGFHRVANLEQVAEALLRSPSAFLRALGAQLLVVDRMMMVGDSDARPPDDPMAAIARLRALNVPAPELASYAAVWLACARARSNKVANLAEAFLSSCEGVDQDGLSEIVGYILNRDRWSIPRLIEVADRTPSEVAVCRGLLDALGKRFVPGESNNV